MRTQIMVTYLERRGVKLTPVHHEDFVWHYEMHCSGKPWADKFNYSVGIAKQNGEDFRTITSCYRFTRMFFRYWID